MVLGDTAHDDSKVTEDTCMQLATRGEMDAGAQRDTAFSLLSLRPQPMEWRNPHSSTCVDFPFSIHPFWKRPHRSTQRRVITDTVMATKDGHDIGSPLILCRVADTKDGVRDSIPRKENRDVYGESQRKPTG